MKTQHINETDKRYLQSDFLSTAGFIKATLPKITISYLEHVNIQNHDIEILKRANIRVKAENRERQIDSIVSDSDYVPLVVEETEEYKEYLASDTKDQMGGIQMQTKWISNEKVLLPKTKTALKDYLTDTVFSEYMNLAKLNDKSIKTVNIQPGKELQKKGYIKDNIKKYVYGDIDFIFDDSIGIMKEAAMRQLVTKIVMTGNIIAQYYRRGPASFVVIHPYLMKYMEYIPGFMSYSNNSYEKINKIGSLMGLDIFVNTNQDKNLVLVGRKGDHQNVGVSISEYTTEIFENTIEWRGAVVSIGNPSKYMYDTFKVEFTSNLPWVKRFLFKKFLK